jgi:hypothetical protein
MIETIPEYLFDLWFLMAGRIAPQLCCRITPPMHGLFQAALHEVARNDGDLDLAVRCLHDIIAHAPTGWMVFQQAGELLNIIEWRRTYHPVWFSPSVRGKRLKSGRCGPFIAQAMALLQAGADDDALDLTQMIIEKSDDNSDDKRLAYLIRAAVLICRGETAAGEEEFVRAENCTLSLECGEEQI